MEVIYLMTILTGATIINSYLAFKAHKGNQVLDHEVSDLKLKVNKAFDYFEKELTKKANKYYKNSKSNNKSSKAKKKA